MKYPCVVCGGEIGNPVFTLCDLCWPVEAMRATAVTPPESTLTLPKSRIEAALREAWDDGWMHGDLSADRSDLKRDAYIRTTLAELEQP